MNTRPVADISGFSPYQAGPIAPLWWGMIGLIVIESVVFGSFISGALFLRAQTTVWPPAGTSPPDLLLPTINTVVLLASSVALHYGDKGIAKGSQDRLLKGMLGAAALAVIFLILKVVEYSGVSYRWDSHAYGSVTWTIIGFHSAHVASVLLKATVVTILAARGYFTAERRLGVTINGIYWHFVVLVWIPLYVLLYWVPRL
jgi:cytochrome c oxidase subunit III